MTTDTESAHPDSPSPRRPRRESGDPAQILADALTTAPPEVLDALGGAPVAVPSQAARRVVASPAARRPVVDAPGTEATAAVPGRAANPLFDGPDKAIQRAAVSIRTLRAALGSAASAMDAAADLYDGAVASDTGALQTAALREGFDLAAAAEVVAEFRAFLDRHKPKTPAS